MRTKGIRNIRIKKVTHARWARNFMTRCGALFDLKAKNFPDGNATKTTREVDCMACIAARPA